MSAPKQAHFLNRIQRHGSTLNTIAILISMAAALAYINHRFLRIPMTIGLMLPVPGMASLALILLEGSGPARRPLRRQVGERN